MPLLDKAVIVLTYHSFCCPGPVMFSYVGKRRVGLRFGRTGGPPA